MQRHKMFLISIFWKHPDILYELFPFTFLVSCFFGFFSLSYFLYNKKWLYCVVMWQKHNEQLCGINIIHNTTQFLCYMMLNIYHVDWFNHIHILQQQAKVSNLFKNRENFLWIFDFFHFLRVNSYWKTF